jgi:hypothetical protein
MNLYLSHGHIWTGTQADAKEAQGGAKDYKSVDVPTDKPGLIAFLNDLVNGPPSPSSSTRVEPDLSLEEVAAAMPGFALTMPNTDTFAVTPPVYRPPATNEDCPACNRSARVAKIAINSQAAVNIMADIEDVSDAGSLDRIIALAESRKASL